MNEKQDILKRGLEKIREENRLIVASRQKKNEEVFKQRGGGSMEPNRAMRRDQMPGVPRSVIFLQKMKVPRSK